MRLTSFALVGVIVAVSVSISSCVPSSITVTISDQSGLRLETFPDLIKWQPISASRSSFSEADEVVLALNSSRRYQQFDGIGGSFMRAGASLLNQMPSEVQEQMLVDLFDKEKGAAFTLGKIPIGATDFGIPEWYTYADEPQDKTLPLFSIDHDLDEQEGFIPYVLRAFDVAGEPLRLEATF